MAVVAGSGVDATGRVAYVKTVYPAAPSRAVASSRDGSGSDVQPSAAAAAAAAADHRRDEMMPESSDAGAVKHMVVSADINLVSLMAVIEFTAMHCL